ENQNLRAPTRLGCRVNEAEAVKEETAAAVKSLMLYREQIALTACLSQDAGLHCRVEPVECNRAVWQEAFDKIQVGQDKSVWRVLRIEAQSGQIFHGRVHGPDLTKRIVQGLV